MSINFELPSEAQRTEAYNQELVRRFRTGQYLTKADKQEALQLIASSQAEPRTAAGSLD